MKYVKKKEKKKTGVVVLSAVVVCLVLLIAAALVYLELSGTINLLDGKGTEGSVNYRALPADLTIETPYTDLKISEVWKDSMYFYVQNGESSTVSFAAKVQETMYPLFDIFLNDAAGDTIGYLTLATGEQVPVAVHAYDIPTDACTEEEQITLYEMQEELNLLLTQLELTEQAENAAEVPAIAVETPYAVLQYPGIWKEYIRTEMKTDEGCVISFFGTVPGKAEQHLYDVCIGRSGEILMGVLPQNADSVEVYITLYPLEEDSSWSDADGNMLHGMQDSVNDVIAQLGLVKQEAEDEIVEETAAVEIMAVQTPYGELQYSGIQNCQIRSEVTEENGCVIRFFGSVPEKAEQHLFDIVIGGSGDTLMGMLTNADGTQVAVYVTVSDLPEGAVWTGEETEQFYRMQDIMNVLLDQLSLSEPVTEEPEEENADAANNGENGDITVSTYYATLQYPGKWKNYLRTAIANESGCKISFYGTVPGYAEVHLFDIVINGTSDIPAGTLATAEGTEVPVGLNIPDIATDGNMTDDEIGILYGMQEDINYILQKLEVSGSLSS